MHELAKKVIIGIPTTGGCKNATEIWLLVQAQRSFRVIYGVGPLSVEDSRTQVASKFLGVSKDFTHLLFLDYDIVPPMNVIQSLYDRNADIVSANYPLYIEKYIHSSGFKRDPENKEYYPLPYTGTGYHEVDAIGLGCALIKREVLEKAVYEACFSMRYAMKDGIFKMADSDDITFSKVCKKLGFKIFIDLDQHCDHYKTVSLAGIIEDVQDGTIIYDEKSKGKARL